MLQLARYALVGLVNSLVGYTVIFMSMVLLDFSAVLSNALGYMVGLITSFLLNKKYTFKEGENNSKTLLSFLVVFIVAYLLNLGSLLMLIKWFDVVEVVAQIPSVLIFFIVSFFLNKYFVFRFDKGNEVFK